MNNFKYLLLLLIISNIFYSCKPSQQLVWHEEKIEELITDHPELKKQLKLDSLRKKGELSAVIDIKDSIELIRDTTEFNTVLDSILFYKRKIDSLNLVPKTDSIIIKYKIKYNDSKKQLQDKSITNQRFEIDIPIVHSYEDSLIYNDLKLKFFLYNGTLNITSYDTLKFKYNKTDYTLKVNRKYNFFNWIKDEKTIILLIVLFLLMLFLFLIKK